MADNLWIGWPKDASGEDTRAILANEYNDHGAWARHYSTVRMTVGTFFVTAATSIIYLRWDAPERRTAILAAATLLIGIALFLRFSHLTFKEMNKQRRIVAAYRTALGNTNDAPKPLPPIWRGEPACICAAILLLFVGINWFWQCDARNPGQALELKVPVSVQVGAGPAASFQVPVTVTVPAKAGR